MKRKQCACGNLFNEGEIFTGEVLGVSTQLETKNLCRTCALRYANTFSTRCVVCGEPILPGMPVGGTVEGKFGKGFAHLEGGRYNCAVYAAFCGTWGKGEVIPHPSLVTLGP